MELVVDDRQSSIKIEEEIIKTLEKAAKESLAYEGWEEDFEVSLSLVDNEEIHQLNKIYRGKDCPTDVLSFPMIDEDDPMIEEKLLGDIVISVERAAEQAEEYGHSFLREMTYLTVHSMFHLMGYDHMDEETTKLMRNKEETVLSKLGIERY